MASLRSIFLATILCLLYTSSAFVYKPLPPALHARSDSSKACITDVDNDLYGTGVRIGLYPQWGSGFILRNLASWDARSRVRTASNIITAAIAVATVVNIMKRNALSVDYLL